MFLKEQETLIPFPLDIFDFAIIDIYKLFNAWTPRGVNYLFYLHVEIHFLLLDRKISKIEDLKRIHTLWMDGCNT